MSTPAENVPQASPVVVKVKVPYNGQAIGKLVNVWVMRSATGSVRTKYSVEFRHSRTKSRTVSLALELEDIEEMH